MLETILIKEQEPTQTMEKQPAKYKAVKNTTRISLPKEEKIKNMKIDCQILTQNRFKYLNEKEKTETKADAKSKKSKTFKKKK